MDPAGRRRAFWAAALLVVMALGAMTLALFVRLQGRRGDVRTLQDRGRQLSYNTACRTIGLLATNRVHVAPSAV